MRAGSGGVSPDNAIFITTPALATKMRTLVGPKFNHQIISSSYLTAAGAGLGTAPIIALEPSGLATGYSGAVQIEVSEAAVIHEEDTNPQNIGIVGTPNIVSAPSRSVFQTACLAIRLRGRCAWTVQSNAVSYIAAATW
jgi:hypothetical protein